MMSIEFNSGIFESVIAAVLVLAYCGINIWYGARLIFNKKAFDKHNAWINKPTNIWLVAWAALMMGIVIGSSLTNYISFEAAEFIFFVIAWPYAVFIILPQIFLYAIEKSNAD